MRSKPNRLYNKESMKRKIDSLKKLTRLTNSSQHYKMGVGEDSN
jgi:hypothetical protein